MGWIAINDTANRRINLAALDTATTQLENMNSKLAPIVAQLAAAEGVIDHLVEIGVMTSHVFMDQFEMEKEGMDDYKQIVQNSLNAFAEMSSIYQLPRSQRPVPKFSGRQFAEVASQQVSRLNRVWDQVPLFKTSPFCDNLKLLANDVPGVPPEDKAVLTTLINTFESIN